MNDKKSILFVNNIPSLYRKCLFENIIKLSPSYSINVEFDYLSASESVRDWNSVDLSNYERIYKVLYQSRNKKTPTSDYIINYGYLSRVFSKEVVVYFGYNYTTYLISGFTRKLFGKKNVLFCETTNNDTDQSLFKKITKRFLLRFIFDRYIVPGCASKDYLCYLGIDPLLIYKAPNSSELRPFNMAEIRTTRTPIRLLFVGRLSEEKNILNMISTLKSSDFNFNLSIVGTGPQQSKVKDLIKGKSNFNYLGGQTPDELKSIFSEHDVLILPSKAEPWGLVVNEAINFGLAVLVSNSVGCHHELVRNNGEIFCNTKDDFLGKLHLIINNLEDYSAESIKLSKTYTAQYQASCFLKSLETLL